MRVRVQRLAIIAAVLLVCSFGSAVNIAGAASPDPAIHWLAWSSAKPLPAGEAPSSHIQWASGPSDKNLRGNAETTSDNWSGYIETGATFTGASGDWVVPSVQASEGLEDSATWVGIDGTESEPDLLQSGTTQETVNGATTYFAWFENLPYAPENLFAVNPGDKIEDSIIETSTPGTWQVTVIDESTDVGITGQATYDGPEESAEWIEEAPTVDNSVATLANFGSVPFSATTYFSPDPATAGSNPVQMVNSGGTVIAYPSGIAAGGDFTITYGSPAPPASPVPTPSPPATPHGYWLVGADGGIFTFGSAQFYGSTGNLTLQRPVVAITPTSDRGGYWLVASDGGLFAFGDSGFYGSIPGLGIAPAGASAPDRLDAPIVGMVPSATGHGYFMVASDGGVFAFGDAQYEGSCPGIGGCSGAAVAVMPDASGHGYWLVTSTGRVYDFGDAADLGSPSAQSVVVTSAVRSTDGDGYAILYANGAVATYGDFPGLGGPVGSVGGYNPATAIFTDSVYGYWVVSANGTMFSYGGAPLDGDMAGQHLNSPIIAGTGW